MKRSDPRTPRAWFAVAAAAITTATLALAVVMPATQRIEPTYDDVATREASERRLGQSGTITAIDVVGARRAHATPIAQSQPAADRAS